jgi:hypothetical protein
LGLSLYNTNAGAVGAISLGGLLYVMDSATTTGITSEDTTPFSIISQSAGLSGNSLITTTGSLNVTTYFGAEAFIYAGTNAPLDITVAFRAEVTGTVRIEDVAIWATEMVV